MSLLKLPDEILDLICSYCRPLDLKNLRACCKRLSQVAESSLFTEIVAVKALNNHENLVSISTHPSIRNCIRSFVYDVRYVEAHDSVLRTGPESFAHTDAGWSFLWVFLWDLEAPSTFPHLSRVSLKDGLDRWGNRRRTHPLLIPKARPDGLRYGVQQDAKHAALDLFRILARTRWGHAIIALELEGIPWATLCEGHGLCPDDADMSNIFQNLKNLSLYFGSAPCDFANRMTDQLDEMDTARGYARLGRLLNRSACLEALRIRFRYYPDWKAASHWPEVHTDLLPAHVLGSESFYPSLKHLHIDTYISNLDEWLSFFERHAPTLTRLDLGSIRLQHFQSQGAAPCWVKVLKEMQRLLHLKDVNFNGLLISGSRRWNVRDRKRANAAFFVGSERAGIMLDLTAIPSSSKKLVVDYEENAGIYSPVYFDHENCLKSQVEKWFLEGGKCPLDRAARGTTSTQTLLELVVDPYWRGDYSWRIK